MIQEIEGDLLEDGADVLVNAVDCVGTMVAGISQQFRRKYPEMYERYREDCDQGKVQIGTIASWTAPDGQVVANFPTMHLPGSPSRLVDITVGLQALREGMEDHGLKSVAIPALGCGFGGLQYEDVKNEIELAFAGTEIDVRLYKPR